MNKAFLGRLLLDPAFRAAAYRDATTGERTVLAPSHPLRAFLEEMPPERLRDLSERVDRELVAAVLMGRPPNDRLVTEAVWVGTREGGEMTGTDLPRALWRAMTDEGFRHACFGDARTAVRDAGYELTEKELGELRWFDHEKLAALGERIAAIVDEVAGPQDADQTQSPGRAEDPEEAALRALHTAHARRVNALRERGRDLLAHLPAYAPGEFDPGPPVPSAAQLRGILQLIRWHGWDLNLILRDSGYSLGRLLLLVHDLRRLGLELPPADRTVESDAAAVTEWLGEAFRPPALDERFHQSSCDPAAAVGRVAHIARHTWLRNRELLVLGDDDGLSLALARHTEARVHVVDIDERVLAALAASAHGVGLDLELHHHDLREPLPAELVGRFALVSADPPQSETGEQFFLDRAADALVPELGHRVYCSITPMWMGLPAFGSVLAHMARRGFASREVLKGQMTFSVRRPLLHSRPEESPTGVLVHETMIRTLNMACDVHVFERVAIETAS